MGVADAEVVKVVNFEQKKTRRMRQVSFSVFLAGGLESWRRSKSASVVVWLSAVAVVDRVVKVASVLVCWRWR